MGFEPTSKSDSSAIAIALRTYRHSVYRTSCCARYLHSPLANLDKSLIVTPTELALYPKNGLLVGIVFTLTRKDSKNPSLAEQVDSGETLKQKF